MHLKLTFIAAMASPELIQEIQKSIVLKRHRECQSYLRSSEYGMVALNAKDAECWKNIMDSLQAGKIAAARKQFSAMDTASRDYIADINPSLKPEAKKVFDLSELK